MNAIVYHYQGHKGHPAGRLHAYKPQRMRGDGKKLRRGKCLHGAFAKQFHRAKDVCRGLADNDVALRPPYMSILHYTHSFSLLSCIAVRVLAPKQKTK